MMVRLVHPTKAEPPMLVSPSGRVMELRPVQPEKAEPPMLVTLSGSVMEAKPVQPLKAPSPMLVTPTGMTVDLHPTINVLVDVSMSALQLLRESNTGLLPSTTIEVRPLQP